ncbi:MULTISPECIES: MarR family winged helix-turn-helix transcriptional regulator [Pontibacillus]|uniref:MarR family transcriptional regulator n=1 Tax=Pontibacillus chungwhensis TaxID=265426 RepID=A0ABY8V6H9_9BACI|nr:MULTISPECIES: MarR family transcriptional regulator [Pontibacillus]MCD5322166.1 MarR family transcriptional regulator [Pontibacillus sp. HN14]WIF99461.1 MarR family transcriptional regulator [Pontibacillus chungwhensis]
MTGKKEAERLRYFILAAQRQGNRIYNESLSELGLTSSKAEVLSVLQQNGPLSLKQLGSLLICETGSPSRLIQRLVEEDLIERTPNPNDSRSTILQLTEIGREKSERVTLVEDQIHEKVSDQLNEKELQEANALMGKLLKGLGNTGAIEKRGFLDEE